jgi:hypothetical protein
MLGYTHRLRGPVLALLTLPGLAVGADHARTLVQAMAAATSQALPTITILPAASGAPLESYAGGTASLSFGRAAYYGGPQAAGVDAQKNSRAMVISTRFALKVDCNGASSVSLTEVAISLFAIDPSYTVSVDGAKLSSAPSTTLLRCGSVSQHQLEVEITTTRPAGPIDSMLAFSVKPIF